MSLLIRRNKRNTIAMNIKGEQCRQLASFLLLRSFLRHSYLSRMFARRREPKFDSFEDKGRGLLDLNKLNKIGSPQPPVIC